MNDEQIKEPTDVQSCKIPEGIERCQEVIDIVIADGVLSEDEKDMLKMIALQENVDYNEIIEYVEQKIEETKASIKIDVDNGGMERCKEIADLVIADAYLSEDDKNLLKMVALQENVDYDEIIAYIEQQLAEMQDDEQEDDYISSTQYAESYDENFEIPISRTLFHNWLFIPEVSVLHDGIHLLGKHLQFPFTFKGWRGFVGRTEEVIKPEDIVCYRKNRAIVSYHVLMVLPWQGYKIYGMSNEGMQMLNDFILKYTELGRRIQVSRKVKGNRLFVPNLYVKGDHIMYWKRLGLLGLNYATVYLNLHDIAFFNIYKSTIGKKLYFGYESQIFIKGISSNDTKNLYEYCKQFSHKLSQKGEMKEPKGLIYKIKHFLHLQTETVTLTDEAVLYYHATLRRQESTYLPFKEVEAIINDKPKFAFLSTAKRLKLLGIQNIVTQYKFDIDFVNKIDKIAKVKELEQEYCLKSMWWVRKYWVHKRPSIVFTTDGQIIYSKPQYRKYAAKNDGEVVFYYVQKNSWLKRTLYLCLVDNNIRVDQHHVNYDMIIDGFNAFRWVKILFFFGSLKKFFKNKGFLSYEQYLKDNDYKRKEIKQELKEMENTDFSGREQQDVKKAGRKDKIWMKQMEEKMKDKESFNVETL